MMVITSTSMVGCEQLRALSLRAALRVLVLCALVLLLVLSLDCEAADKPTLSNELSLADVLKVFESKILDTRDTIIKFCQTLMFYLGAISIVIESAKALLKHEDINYFFYMIMRIMITFGLVYYIIFHGYSISSDIINSLIQLGTGVDTKGNLEGMLDLIQSFFSMSDTYAKQMAGKSKIYYYFFLIIMYVLLAAFILRYVTYYIWAIMLSVLGLILIPFGALHSTRHLAFNYLKTVLSTGVALMTLCFVYIIGTDVIKLMTKRVNDYLAAGGTIHLQDAGYIVLVMLFVVVMAFSLPNMMAAMVTTASSAFANLSPIRTMRNQI